MLVVVRRGVVARESRLGGGHPHDAVRVGGEIADAARTGAFGIQPRQPVARHAVELPRTAAGIDRPAHRIGDDGRERSAAARQTGERAVPAPGADHLVRRSAVDVFGIGRERKGRRGRFAERAGRPLPRIDAVQPAVGSGDPRIAPVIDIHRRHVAAQRRGVEKGVDTHGRGVVGVAETRHAQPGDGHPRIAAAVVQAVRHTVVLRIDAPDERHHVLELLGITVQSVDVEIIGREPEMSVRILAHGDEAVVRQRREIARRGAEILECVSVEAADAVPRANPHEAARIGVDVGDTVVRHSVQRGVGLEKALRRRRPGERDGGGQQKGQQ